MIAYCSLTLRTLLVLTCCLFSLVAANVARAQNEYLVGRKVMTLKGDVEARVLEKVIRQLEIAKVYEVTEVNGDWLWFSKAVGGWVKRSDVIPFDAAIDHFNLLVQRNPTDTNFYLRGLAWKAKGELDIALGDFNESLRRNPGAVAYNARGGIWKAKGEFDKAISDYTEAIRRDPQFASAYNNRSVVFLGQGQYDTAIDDLNEALRINPLLATAYLHRGNAWKDKGELRKALLDYNKAIEIDPLFAKAYYGRGSTRLLMEDYDHALGDGNKVLELAPDIALAYALRGSALLRKEAYESGLDDFDQALRLDAKHPVIFFNRAVCKRELGQFTEAEQDYLAALALDDNYHEAFNELAWMLATRQRLGNSNDDKAVEYATKACELTNWKDDSYVDTLSAACAAAGDFEAAKNWLRKAIELNPDSRKELRDKMFAAYEADKPYLEEPDED